MYIEINDLSEIHQAARQFLAEIDNQNVFAFYGDMGAGKTTFIKAVCEELGVQEPITSPTFAIINEYRDKKGKSIYHFDFYRIKKLEEVFDFGYEDYFYSGNLCFIEWPELVESLLPENVVRLSLRQTENGARILENIQ
ncbi:MAG: tRNA threonylcarbamoyladenosine biosynthesis protein TsaE [Bacteroidota bacterium]|nr:tRNA threonylcarbamoyladenosine biosynthesis protein TsaE [Bacteroidota bacterium]